MRRKTRGRVINRNGGKNKTSSRNSKTREESPSSSSVLVVKKRSRSIGEETGLGRSSEQLAAEHLGESWGNIGHQVIRWLEQRGTGL